MGKRGDLKIFLPLECLLWHVLASLVNERGYLHDIWHEVRHEVRHEVHEIYVGVKSIQNKNIIVPYSG